MSSLTNEDSLKEAARKWLLKSYESYDTFNIEGLSKLYTEDAVLRFAGGEDIKGKENIKAFFTSTFPLLHSMTHNLIHLDITPNRIYQQTDITYILPDQRKVTVHAMAVSLFEEENGWDMGKGEGGRMSRFEVYLDPGFFKRTGDDGMNRDRE